MSKIYLLGSMRNRGIISIANTLREDGHSVFDDWISAGPEADDYWQKYEAERGRSYREALNGYHAKNQFHLDQVHIADADVGVMVAPCGKSAHLELGVFIGSGRPGYIYLEETPERFDIMHLYATDVTDDFDELRRWLK